jgi:hypothetical protein
MNKVVLHYSGVAERENNIKKMSAIPDLKIFSNNSISCFDAFCEILFEGKDDSLLFLEDDAYLCDNFNGISSEFIALHDNRVIQFMDMKKSDISTSEMNGSSFCMSVCVYIPQRMIQIILKHKNQYLLDNPKHQTAHDYLIGYSLKKNKEKYILHRPCLVQHLKFKSIAHKGASTKRQTRYFKDGEILI